MFVREVVINKVWITKFLQSDILHFVSRCNLIVLFLMSAERLITWQQLTELKSMFEVISFQRLVTERDTLKETIEELRCTQVRKGEIILSLLSGYHADTPITIKAEAIP